MSNIILNKASINTKLRIPEFTPEFLFTRGEQGVWYDPSDFSTMYQDSAGTIPVTALGQPVGLVLDKSRGNIFGANQVRNGTFNSTAEWTTSGGWSISSNRLNGSSATNSAVQTGVCVIGRTYRVKYTVMATAGASLRIRNSVVGSTVALIGLPAAFAVVTQSAIFTATGTDLYIEADGSVFTGWIDDLSVEELTGLHLRQTTPTSRPTVQARVNRLVGTESFPNSAWNWTNVNVTSNAATDPFGGNSASLIVETAVLGNHWVNQDSIRLLATVVRVYLKSAGRTFAIVAASGNNGAFVNLSGAGSVVSTFNASATIQSVGNGWFLCTVTANYVGNSGVLIGPSIDGRTANYSGDGTSGIYAFAADERYVGENVQYPYQRVTTATDYADVGAPRYLQFDGVDDSLQTATNLDLTSTDKVTVVAGVYRPANTAGCIAETANGMVYNGSWAINTGTSTTTLLGSGFWYGSRGTAFVLPTLSGFVPPVSVVLTARSNIHAPLAQLRGNAGAYVSNTSSQGTGMFGSWPLRIGRRIGGDFPWQGRLHSLIVRGALTDGRLLSDVEKFVGSKTGITL